MAKGRRLTSSRSELLLGSNYSYGYSQSTNGPDESELREEDVWSMVDDSGDRSDLLINNPQGDWSPRATVESRRHISHEDRHLGGLSLAFEDTTGKTTSQRVVHQVRGHDSLESPRGQYIATSAPVNVPDWSKIYPVDSVESLHDADDGCWFDDRETERVPPHEYLARSRRNNGMSVFEGVGRTLKGRDLRRVRDAVWSQTGFNG